LKNKHLLDVGKALKIKDLTHTAKPLQSHCKATAKHQTVENQGLGKILCSFAVHCKEVYPKPRPLPLARFLQARSSFFLYIAVSLQKLQN